MSGSAAAALSLSVGERETLERLTRGLQVPHQQVLQARVLLLAADGVANIRIAEEVGVRPATVRAWRRRFGEDGLAGLGLIRKGRGRRSSISAEKVAEIVRLTTTTTPPGHTHWSCRTMADQVGVSPATVQRIWSNLGLKPHQVDTFKVSHDPQFEDKLVDVVGLYLNPPEKAIVLCMDEKSQIQALDRTQASLPMVAGRAGTMTHDYKRNGTTTLFAALDVLTGKVIGQCLPRHRHEEFITFLKTIDAAVPAGLAVHLILDNYATHKHPAVQRWLQRHKRFHLHFTPTSSSWMNQVERWFRDLTDKNIRRGVFPSVGDLIASIEEYLNTHNENPKPYVWTATAESILAKVARARATLEQVAN
ncbi:IS630 family transposase [Gordonia sp. NPDC003424]